jgi:hypothetical protein
MKKLIFVLVAGAFVSAPAFADMVELRFVSASSPNSTLTYWNGTQFVTETGNAANYKIDLRANTPDPFPGYLTSGVQATLCLDIADGTSTSWKDYSVVALKDAPDAFAGPMGATRAAYLQELLDRYWGVSGTNVSALQMAVWEIIDEGRKDNTVPSLGVAGGFDVKTGTFKATGAQDTANGYLWSLTGNWTPTNAYKALSNTSLQDFVVKVPVPAAVLLGFLGLGAAGIRLRRFA